MRYGLLTFVLSISLICSKAQDLTGAWLATSAPTSAYITPSKVVIELYQYNDSMLSGVSHFYYPDNYYEHFQLSGRFDKKGRRVLINEDSLINHRTQPGATVISGRYSCTYDEADGKMILLGIWRPINPGAILQFRIEKDLPRKKTDTLKTIKVATPNIDRVEKVAQVIEIDKLEADSITIDVYDNGEVDGDIVTVLINDDVVISKQKISAKPLTFKTNLNKETPIAKISMIAENLGSIPPNTALMIITTKQNRYTVRLSSDLKTNAAVELFLKQ